MLGLYVTHEGFAGLGEGAGFVGYHHDTPRPEELPEHCREICVVLVHSEQHTGGWLDFANANGLRPVVLSRRPGGIDGVQYRNGVDTWFLYGEQNETLQRILDAETCEQIEKLLNDLKREDKDLESLLGRHLLAVGNRFLEKQDKTLIVLPEGMDTTELTPEEVRQLRKRYGC